jgi:hypothetical protein
MLANVYSGCDSIEEALFVYERIKMLTSYETQKSDGLK